MIPTGLLSRLLRVGIFLGGLPVSSHPVVEMAGAIWQALNGKGHLPLPQLQRVVKGKAPVFDWAIGWLAREDKIVITPDKRSFRIRLK